MKSLKARFDRIAEKHPICPTIICFNAATQGQGFSKKTLYYWFNKLVDPDDYDQDEKKQLIEFAKNNK